MDVGIRDLKNNLSRYLEKVKAGGTVLVTDRGKPVAILGPVSGNEAAKDFEHLERLVAEGRVTRPKRPKVDLSELPGPLPTGSPPGEIHRIIDEGRGPR